MDIERLRYFVALADHQHFTKAAESLHISQPYLSRVVRSLEAELKVKLVDRTTRQVRLTPAGQTFSVRIAHALNEFDLACKEVRDVDAGLAGRLRVGFVGSITYSWLPHLVRTFRRRYPGVEVAITSEMLTGVQDAALRMGHLDVGVMRGPRDPSLESVILAREGLYVAIPTDHRLSRSAGEPIDVSELRDERFISYADSAGSTTHRLVVESCMRTGFHPDIGWTVDDTHTLVSLVAAGMGVALTPAATRNFAVEGVSYFPVAEGNAVTMDLLACWTPESADFPLVRNFGRLCEELATVEVE